MAGRGDQGDDRPPGRDRLISAPVPLSLSLLWKAGLLGCAVICWFCAFLAATRAPWVNDIWAFLPGGQSHRPEPTGDFLFFAPVWVSCIALLGSAGRFGDIGKNPTREIELRVIAAALSVGALVATVLVVRRAGMILGW